MPTRKQVLKGVDGRRENKTQAEQRERRFMGSMLLSLGLLSQLRLQIIFISFYWSLSYYLLSSTYPKSTLQTSVLFSHTLQFIDS